MDKKALTFGLGILFAMVLLSFAIWHTDGPASQCEDAGGQMLVGPGGETSCVNTKTFVPLEDFEESAKSG